MRIATIVATLGVLGLATPARADDDIAQAMMVLIVAPLVAADAGATAAFGSLDASHTQGVAYGTTELAYNAAAGRIYRDLALESEGRARTWLAVGGGVHTLLALDGIARIGEDRGWSTGATLATAATIGSTMWFLDDPNDVDHPRGARFGVAEAAVNAPIAAGLLYLTIADARAGHPGRATLAGLGTALTGELTGEGLARAFAHHPHPRLARVEHVARAAHLAPTMVADGRDVGVGLGTGGRW